MKETQTISTRSRFAPLWVTSPSPIPRRSKNSNIQGSFSVDKERLVYLFNSGHRCQKNKKKTYQLSVNTAHFVTAGQHLVIDVIGQKRKNKQQILSTSSVTI